MIVSLGFGPIERDSVLTRLFPGVVSGVRWKTEMSPLTLDGESTVDIVSPVSKTPLAPDATTPGIRLREEKT